MSRRFGIAAASTLALALAALAFRLLVPHGPNAELPPRSTEAKPAVERATSRTLLPSATSQPDSAFREDVPERIRPASILDTLENSRDPHAIQAALSAVLTTYSSRSTRKPAPGPELEQALARHVDSDTGAIARAALAAARVPLMAEAPGAELVHAIVSQTGPEEAPGRRTLALDALNLLRPDRRGAPVLAALEQALSASQPEVVTRALFALADSGPSLADLSVAHRGELGQRVLELLGHANPGVRGRALFVLGELADLVVPESRLAAALNGLQDREPYVRGEAASLIGRCGAPQGIHALMPHIEDLAAARYEIAFVDIEGRPSIAEQRVPGRPRVADAALFSSLALSRKAAVSRPLALSVGDGVETEARVLENAAKVRKWYAEVAAQIPR